MNAIIFSILVKYKIVEEKTEENKTKKYNYIQNINYLEVEFKDLDKKLYY